MSTSSCLGPRARAGRKCRYVLYMVSLFIRCTMRCEILAQPAGSSALCLEYRVSWVRVPPEVANFYDCLGCAVLLCLVCLFDLACFFLPSFSHLSLKHVHVVQTVISRTFFTNIFKTIHSLILMSSLPDIILCRWQRRRRKKSRRRWRRKRSESHGSRFSSRRPPLSL